MSKFPAPQKSVLDHHLQTLQPYLDHWKKEGKPAPVLLLTGPRGVGKRTLAHYLADWMGCKDYNLTEILPEEGGESLKIDQFRKLKETQGFGGWGDQYRVFLIPNAEQMTPQATNSLLKLLEEPPTGWVFILTSGDSSLLLPTLLSRCQVIRLRPFPDATLATVLRESGVPEVKIRQALDLGAGSWKRALLIQEESVWDGLQSIQRFFKNPAAELDSVLDWASKETDHYQLLLDELEKRSAQLARQNSEDPKLIQFWVENSDRVARSRQNLAAPLNRKLQIQDLLIPWLQEAEQERSHPTVQKHCPGAGCVGEGPR